MAIYNVFSFSFHPSSSISKLGSVQMAPLSPLFPLAHVWRPFVMCPLLSVMAGEHVTTTLTPTATGWPPWTQTTCLGKLCSPCYGCMLLSYLKEFCMCVCLLQETHSSDSKGTVTAEHHQPLSSLQETIKTTCTTSFKKLLVLFLKISQCNLLKHT